MEPSLILERLSKIPRLSLGTWPTPMHRLFRLEQSLDTCACPEIWIKRDDLTGIGCGGNKVRNLEYLLADALKHQATDVIASGGSQSNLCSLTAACCAKLGLHCHLVHDGIQHKALGNQLLNEILAADEIFLGTISWEERDAQVEALERQLLSEGKRPYIIRNGATSGLGALGYVQAIAELRTQTDSPMTIFAPGGNGGIASGLIYGNWLFCNPFHIVIISVEDCQEVLTEHILKTIQEAEQILGIPTDSSLLDACTIDDAYRGQGWSCNTPESSRMVYEFARLEGIFLENVYTSKPAVGMQQWIKEKKLSTPACFLHTGGFASLFAQL